MTSARDNHLLAWFWWHPLARPAELPDELLDLAKRVTDPWEEGPAAARLRSVLLSALQAFRSHGQLDKSRSVAPIGVRDLLDGFAGMFAKLGVEIIRRAQALDMGAEWDRPFADVARREPPQTLKHYM